ncbi:MAG: hypothetical protein WCO26_11525 [Deltaproteobacteria bacterium]
MKYRENGKEEEIGIMECWNIEKKQKIGRMGKKKWFLFYVFVLTQYSIIPVFQLPIIPLFPSLYSFPLFHSC